MTPVTKLFCRRWPKLGRGSPMKREAPEDCRPAQLQSKIEAIKPAMH
jgi:hypothetical protein